MTPPDRHPAPTRAQIDHDLARFISDRRREPPRPADGLASGRRLGQWLAEHGERRLGPSRMLALSLLGLGLYIMARSYLRWHWAAVPADSPGLLDALIQGWQVMRALLDGLIGALVIVAGVWSWFVGDPESGSPP